MYAKVVKHHAHMRYVFCFQNWAFASANIDNEVTTLTNIESGGMNRTFKYYIFFREETSDIIANVSTKTQNETHPKASLDQRVEYASLHTVQYMDGMTLPLVLNSWHLHMFCFNCIQFLVFRDLFTTWNNWIKWLWCVEKLTDTISNGSEAEQCCSHIDLTGNCVIGFKCHTKIYWHSLL